MENPPARQREILFPVFHESCLNPSMKQKFPIFNQPPQPKKNKRGTQPNPTRANHHPPPKKNKNQPFRWKFHNPCSGVVCCRKMFVQRMVPVDWEMGLGGSPHFFRLWTLGSNSARCLTRLCPPSWQIGLHLLFQNVPQKKSKKKLFTEEVAVKS